ncbi:uncharacterized protein LOC143146831 [Ptiloglossa arizonensis]|uniref:uncharacterized protein LOC143146831 n=1 Tax=Ptiloglossa arizonensis TaxID=3350558 RepID=UPI003FA1959D
MKQVENYKAKCVPQSVSESRNSNDYWNYQQKKSQPLPVGRSRNQEAAASYSSSTTYKPQKDHVCSGPTYSKYVTSHGSDVSQHGQQSHPKSGRDKHAFNYATTRKYRYDEELGNNEKLKYFPEDLENFTEDNAEEDAEEEEDDREETGEFLGKDYDEQEADDEIDEESDTSPPIHRAQRGKKEAMLRQRWKDIEQQQSARRTCCQQRVLSSGQGHSSPARYYHTVAEHDIPEPLSEDSSQRRNVPTSQKSPTRRSPVEYHRWASSRGEFDRYDAVALPVQPRRARTKPEMDHPIDSELGKPRKCNRCGSLSGKKSESSTKNSCRFDDRTNFPTKGPIGDEPESHEQTFSGCCNLRHTANDASCCNDNPSHLYVTKPRRSRDTKSPTIYEFSEQGQVDLTNDYSRSSSRYRKKSADVFTDKAKRLMHPSHGVARVSARYEE